jgi:hypothetical protein
VSQSNVRPSGSQPERPPGSQARDPIGDQGATALRARFDAEILAADLSVPVHDRDQLFVMWAEHQPIRARLRAADIALAEEPSFTQKPAQAGAGVTLRSSPAAGQGGPA